jgi:hypothetical protein
MKSEKTRFGLIDAKMFRDNPTTIRIILIIYSLLLFAVFYSIFGGFIPNASGNLGGDYCLFLPQLLDGAFWFETNGLSEVPWFTPSFGGGLPNFPNHQSMYYSVPQFLCFVFDPLISVKLTLILFGIIGFYGFYIFLRRVFHVSPITSMLGGALFLFNGFFVSRMIIGHLTFHSYMLIPLFLYAMLNNTGIQKGNGWKTFVSAS